MRLSNLFALALVGASLYAAALMGDVVGRALSAPLTAAASTLQAGH